MTWLRHAGSQAGDGPGEVLACPGVRPVRGARRVNAVLTAVRGMVTHAVAAGLGAGSRAPINQFWAARPSLRLCVAADDPGRDVGGVG
jgi:hypothetical protein